MIRPGEIYLADFEEMEPHPIVVVSREELNMPSPARGRIAFPARPLCQATHGSIGKLLQRLSINLGDTSRELIQAGDSGQPPRAHSVSATTIDPRPSPLAPARRLLGVAQPSP
jgi:hypothetical protein